MTSCSNLRFAFLLCLLSFCNGCTSKTVVDFSGIQVSRVSEQYVVERGFHGHVVYCSVKNTTDRPKRVQLQASLSNEYYGNIRDTKIIELQAREQQNVEFDIGYDEGGGMGPWKSSAPFRNPMVEILEVSEVKK